MEHGNDESEGQRMKVQLPPAPRDIDCSRMSAEEFHAHICRGYEDYLAGRVRPAEEVFAEFRERLKQRGVEPACQQEQCHQKWDDFRADYEHVSRALTRLWR